VQSIGQDGRTNLSFTVPEADLAKSLGIAAVLAERFGSPPPTSCPQVAKLTVTGIGLRSHTSLAGRMFNSLAQLGVNVDMISTSEVQVNVVIDGRHGQQALAALEEELADVIV